MGVILLAQGRMASIHASIGGTNGFKAARIPTLTIARVKRKV